MSSAKVDVIVIGAGIVGLAHAWMAARRGLSVKVLERTSAAQGATVRNFGMVWPIGQPAGPAYETALRSRELWLELAQMGALQVESCGSLHLAHQSDELELLTEFQGQHTHQASLISAERVVQKCPFVNPQGLLGGMLSPTELRVDPRTAAASIAKWLVTSQGVQIQFDTPVVRASDNTVSSSSGETWTADRIVVCSGSDLQSLHPNVFTNSGLRHCKLQMLSTRIAASPVTNRPHLASGLTLRHYTSFESCQSLAALKQRVASETPELDRFGIHVMASAFANGRLILGDSHEYGNDIAPFDNSEIDELMLRELKKILHLENWRIVERWSGIYCKHPTEAWFVDELAGGVHITVGPGGAGMTMAFGLADRCWNKWEGT